MLEFSPVSFSDDLLMLNFWLAIAVVWRLCDPYCWLLVPFCRASVVAQSRRLGLRAFHVSVAGDGSSGSRLLGVRRSSDFFLHRFRVHPVLGIAWA